MDPHDHYQKLLSQCDLLIKTGNLNAVANLIANLNLVQVPRNVRSSLAKVCRRAGLISHGLRLLYPIIRNEKELETAATPQELSEYAVLLSRNGSVDEALALLNQVDTRVAPEALLYQGFCHISKWNYTEAIGFLESFVTATPDAYTALIASVNLSASYIALGQTDNAAELLEGTLSLAEKAQASRLVGNCFELQAQVLFQKENFAEARACLKKSARIFTDSGGYDQLMTLKWDAVMTSIESRDPEPLQSFRKEALDRQHWESVRDADLYLLKINFQQDRLDHLVFGTPMPPYRQRIQQYLQAIPSAFYVLGSSSGIIFDLEKNELQSRKIHQAIAALTRDFYLPRNMGTLFAELYPNEYFDINSSPLRVRQWIHRTRGWFAGENLPVTIEYLNGMYRLVITGEFGIRLPLQAPSLESNALRLEQLRRLFEANQNFSAEQACAGLSLSRSSFHRLARWGEAQGEIIKSGKGRSTLHLLKKKAA